MLFPSLPCLLLPPNLCTYLTFPRAFGVVVPSRLHPNSPAPFHPLRGGDGYPSGASGTSGVVGGEAGGGRARLLAGSVREAAGRVLELCLDLDSPAAAAAAGKHRSGGGSSTATGASGATGGAGGLRRRLLKKKRGEEAEEEDEEEEGGRPDERGDGSPLAVFLQEAGLGGRGFETRLRGAGFGSVADLLNDGPVAKVAPPPPS